MVKFFTIPIPNKITVTLYLSLLGSLFYISPSLYFTIFDEHKRRLMMVRETRKSFSLIQKWWMWDKERDC